MKNPPPYIRPYCLPLLLALFAFLSCAQTLAAASETPDENLKGYLRLKERFETLALRYSDPLILTCLAVETTAQAWTLAAGRLAEDPVGQARWQARAAEFEKSWSAGRDWEARHRRALKVYYEALSEVVRKLADIRRDGSRKAELEAVLDRTENELALLNRRAPDPCLEREALSRGLLGLARVIVRLFGPEPGRPAELILAAAAEEIRALSRRKDIHFRARLALVYAARVHALTDLIFLLGPAAGPPLSRPLAEVRAALKKNGADPRLPTALSLAWTAQAQASLPLAYWLSTSSEADQGDNL